MDTINVLSKDIRKIVQKDVDYIPGAWVKFYDSPTLGTLYKAKAVEGKEDLGLSLDVVLDQIAEWNFADESGLLPITKDSLEKLPLNLVTWIANQQTEIVKGQEDSKKKLPNV